MTFEDEILADTPLLWWDTRAASGGLVPDASGNGNTGSIGGSPTVDGGDGSLVFGGGDYIQSGNVFGPGTFSAWTLECVVNFASVDFFQTILGLFAGGSNDRLFLTMFQASTAPNDPTLTGEWWNGPTFPTPGGTDHTCPDPFPSTGVPDTGVLYHLVFTGDGTTTNIYVNGSLFATAPETLPCTLSAATAFFAGGLYFGDGVHGLLRHAVFYDHDIGSTRLAAHFAVVFADDPPPPPPPPTVYRDEILADGPVLYYEFEETSGTVAADSSGNAVDGTIVSDDPGYPTFGDSFNFTGNGLGFDNYVAAGVAFAEAHVTTPLDMFGALDSTVSITVEAVIRIDKDIGGADGYDLVYVISDSAGSIFQFCILSPDYTTDVPRIGLFYNGGQLALGDEYPNDNEEHLVQWTWFASANTITTWVDGIKGPSQDMGSALTWSTVTDSVVAGYGDSGSSFSQFRGKISEFSLFNGVLSDSRLIAHAIADGLTPPTAPTAIVTAVSPTSGTTDGGTDVTITGSGFLATTDVQFGGVPVSGGSVVDDNTLDVTSPPHDSGNVHVVVITDAGSSATSSADLFHYIESTPPPPPPEVTSGDQNAADGRASGVGTSPDVPRKKIPVRTDGVPQAVASGSHGLVPQVAFRAAVWNGTHIVYGERFMMDMPKAVNKLGAVGWTAFHIGQLPTQHPNTGDANGSYNIFCSPSPLYFDPPIEADANLVGFESLFINLRSLTIGLTSPLYYVSVTQAGEELTVGKPQLLAEVGLYGAAGSGIGADHPNGAVITYLDMTDIDIPSATAVKPVPAGNYEVSPGVFVAVPAHTLSFTIPDLSVLDDLTLLSGALRARVVKGGRLGAQQSLPIGLLSDDSTVQVFCPFFNANYGICSYANGDSEDPNPGIILYRVNADLTIDFDLDRLTVSNGSFTQPEQPLMRTYALPMDSERVVVYTAVDGGSFQVVRRIGTTLSMGPPTTAFVDDFRGTRLDSQHFNCQHFLFQVNSDDTIDIVTEEFGSNIGTADYFPFALSGGSASFGLDLTNAFVHQIDDTHVAQNHMPNENEEGLGIGTYDHNFIDAHLLAFDSETQVPNPPSGTTGIPFFGGGGRTEATKWSAQFLGGRNPATGAGNEMLLAEFTYGLWVKKHPTTKATSRSKGVAMVALDHPVVRSQSSQRSSTVRFPPSLQALGNIVVDPDNPFLITSNTVERGQGLSVAGTFFTPTATVTGIKLAGTTIAFDSPSVVSAQGNWGNAFTVADDAPLGERTIVARDSSGASASAQITILVAS